MNTASRDKAAREKVSYKSAWISGLVFPGAGYFSLNRPKRAIFIMLASAVFLTGLIQVSMMKANTLMDLLVRGKVAPDMASMMIAMQDISVMSMGWQDYAGYGLLLCWFFSIFDAIRLARKV